MKGYRQLRENAVGSLIFVVFFVALPSASSIAFAQGR
jgi:hypothetical protein